MTVMMAKIKFCACPVMKQKAFWACTAPLATNIY